MIIGHAFVWRPAAGEVLLDRARALIGSAIKSCAALSRGRADNRARPGWRCDVIKTKYGLRTGITGTRGRATRAKGGEGDGGRGQRRGRAEAEAARVGWHAGRKTKTDGNKIERRSTLID